MQLLDQRAVTRQIQTVFWLFLQIPQQLLALSNMRAAYHWNK
jgi:hypothetical protein